MIMSTEALALVAILAAGGLGAAASYVIKPPVVQRRPAHNDITGRVFVAVSGLYSILLAFVVIAVWEQFSDAEHATATEAALMITAYRDTQTFPNRSGQQPRWHSGTTPAP